MNDFRNKIELLGISSHKRVFNPIPHSLPGPEDISRFELSNGIVLLMRRNDFSPSVVISGYLSTGSLADEDDKLGLAGFTASALMRGTTERDFLHIYDMLESAGASLGYDSGIHTTSFGGRALVEDLGMLLDLLADTMRYPVFPDEHVDRLRSQLLASLAIRAQNTSEMASISFDQITYVNHPYSRPEDGFPETIEKIQKKDLAHYHHRYFGPRGMVIVIVGSIDPMQILGMVEGHFGDWRNDQQPEQISLPPLTPLEEIKRKKVDLLGKSQADIVLGVAGPARKSQDFIAAALGNSVFGQFGMMGRIGEEVREKAGLAYYAHSNLGGGIGPGPWSVSAGVAPQNVDRAIEIILREIKKFVQEPVSDEELSDSKANFIGRLPLSLESNNGVASALLNLEKYSLGIDYYRRYQDMVNAVTPEQIRETAASYLDPHRLAIGIAGPPETD